MNRIEKLRKQIKDLDTELADLLALESPSEEQEKRALAIEAEIKQLQAQYETAIKAEEDRKARANQLAALDAQAAQVAPQRRTTATSEQVRVEVKPPNFLEDPKRGFRDHREFLLSVMKAGERGGYSDDPRLRTLASPGIDRHMAAGADEQSTISDAYGGYLIPMGFSPNIMSIGAESDPIAALTTKIPMSNPVVPINARVDKNHTTSVSGGFQVYRRVETQSVTATRTAYEQVVLAAHSLFGVAYATEELLARSPVSFMALIEAGFRDEFGAKLLDERLNGDGAGKYEGILNSPCVVSISKETGQAANSIMKENIDKMRARCWGYGNAVWLYNHDCLPQLRSLVQAIGTAGTTVPYFSVGMDGVSTLDGRPAYATEFCETLGTVGDLILGNWSQYLEGTLTGISSAESIHVRFENHERVFKFWAENDGRCWWRSALTPRNSTATLSPFVTLATRA